MQRTVAELRTCVLADRRVWGDKVVGGGGDRGISPRGNQRDFGTCQMLGVGHPMPWSCSSVVLALMGAFTRDQALVPQPLGLREEKEEGFQEAR